MSPVNSLTGRAPRRSGGYPKVDLRKSRISISVKLSLAGDSEWPRLVTSEIARDTVGFVRGRATRLLKCG